MDYFQIQQDPRINYTPTLLDLGTHFDKRWVINEEYDKIPKITAFHIKEQKFTQYPDLLDRQIPIIYCMRTNGATSPALSDPSCRYFYTEHQRCTMAVLRQNIMHVLQ